MQFFRHCAVPYSGYNQSQNKSAVKAIISGEQAREQAEQHSASIQRGFAPRSLEYKTRLV